MNYEQWRNELFDLPPDADLVWIDRSDEFDAVPPEVAFDYVDRVLVDPEVHTLFTKDQLGKGVHTIYSNCCSDLPFLYTRKVDEERRVEGINNLIHLYRNYFDRHCANVLEGVSDDNIDGTMGYICYMLWEVFILFPGNSTAAMTAAAVGVMRAALESHNDSSLSSAIHGLGHWAYEVPEAAATLQMWLRNPTTDTAQVIEYARAASTGWIV